MNFDAIGDAFVTNNLTEAARPINRKTQKKRKKSSLKPNTKLLKPIVLSKVWINLKFLLKRRKDANFN